MTWLATVSLFGPAFLLPQYLQVLRGLTPFAAGLLLLWQGVGSVGGTLASGQLYNRAGARALILTGGVVIAVTAYALAGWAGSVAALAVLPWILIPRGIGLPLLLQPTNTSSLTGITGASLPDATTLNVVMCNVIASLSIAVLTNLLQQLIRPIGAPMAGKGVTCFRTP